MSHGFNRKDFSDVDVVLVIRPRFNPKDVADLLADTLSRLFAPPSETLH